MPIDISDIKGYFPEFPQIKRQYVTHLLRSSTNSDHKLLFQALDSMLPDSTSSHHFYTLLSSIPTPEDKDQYTRVHVLAVFAWTEYLLTYFSEEIKPLTTLFNNKSELCTPIQFSALLMMLLTRGISAFEIMDSGILHLFAQENYHIAQHITMTYALFQKVVEDKHEWPESIALLTLITQYSMEVQSTKSTAFTNMSLNGQHALEKPPLSFHNPSPVFTFTPSKKNWAQLYEILGFPWIIQTFSHCPKGKCEEVMIEVTQAMDETQIMAICRDIFTKLPEENRALFLNILAVNIDAKHFFPLLKLKTEFSWFLLQANFDALRCYEYHITSDEFRSIVTESPISTASLNTLVDLCSTPIFEPFSDQLCAKMFHLSMKHPAVVMDRAQGYFLFKLGLFRIIQTWCNEEDERVYDELKKNYRHSL